MASLLVNGQNIDVDVEPDTPLLWAIRENLGLTGTKYGCGIGACGACTVLLDGAAVRACAVTVADAAGRKVTTIEGLAEREYCIACSRPGSTRTFRNAVSASPA